MSDLADWQLTRFQDGAGSHDGQSPSLQCQITHEGGRVTIALHGEMDLASAPTLQREALALLALPVESVTLDLADLRFIDSSGLRALVEIHAAAEEHRIGLTLRAVPAQARLVLEVTHLAELFAPDESATFADGFD
jgi:anti-sigma B factor antagonist